MQRYNGWMNQELKATIIVGVATLLKERLPCVNITPVANQLIRLAQSPIRGNYDSCAMKAVLTIAYIIGFCGNSSKMPKVAKSI